MTASQKEIQKEFHIDSDEKRFRNRIDNPYISKKEEKLASRIAAAMPAGGGRLLEAGCGEGNNLHYLRARLPHDELAGMDFAYEKVRFMRKTVSGVCGVCGDASALPFRDEVFDVVLCRDLLHHVNWARESVLSETVRVLRPGGTIVVIESNGKAFVNRLFQLFFPVERGMSDSTPEKLLKLCERFGRAEMEFIEAGFLVRGFAFIAGPPRGLRAVITRPVYAILNLLERVVEYVKPKRRWIYMAVFVKPKQKGM